MAYCQKYPDGGYEYIFTKEEVMRIGGLALERLRESVSLKDQEDEEAQ